MFLRRYLSWSVVSCLVVLLVGSLEPSFSRQVPVTPIPPNVQQAIATCLPPNSNFEYVNSETEGGGTYYEINVSPLPTTPTAAAESSDQTAAEVTPVQADPVNPWRLVALVNSNGCQALTTPTTTEAEAKQKIPDGPRKKLELSRIKQLLDQVGVDKLSGLLTGQDDPNHGGDLPNNPSISADTAWSLKQLGVMIPPGVTVRP